MSELPIEGVLPELRRALRTERAAVLEAPPGAGKTTRVPLALLQEPWLEGQRLVMLEPRRLAARAAAHRMAFLLGEAVGETVGYRVRLDTRVGPRTRVEVVTEGVLTRLLQDDPSLAGVGAVLFDELHERSLHGDLGLALCLQARELFRPDLRLLAMSATLEGGAVAELLQAPRIRSVGRGFPVETRYLAHPLEGRPEDAAARAVHRALAEEPGDVLVFLPGEGEIRRVAAALEAEPLPADASVLPLFGNLPQAEQERAIAPSPAGARKVVLATSIAETSLTIEGVRVVVDSGRMRVPRFSARTGMTRLETIPVSAASAEQRRGRAGRLAPGVCYRLWTEPEQRGLVPHGAPEIRSADLAPLALELALWGAADPAELRWLDPPPEAAYAQARELLAELGAVEAGALTPHGREMARFGLHPRLAHLLLRARELGLAPLGCDLAALLAERDPFRAPDGPPDADLRLRLDVLRGGRAPAGVRVDAGALRRVRAEAGHLRRRLGVRDARPDPAAAGLLLALAYPDRIAQRRRGPARAVPAAQRARGLAVADAGAGGIALAGGGGAGRRGRREPHLPGGAAGGERGRRRTSASRSRRWRRWNGTRRRGWCAPGARSGWGR